MTAKNVLLQIPQELELLIERLFYQIGRIVGRYPFPCALIPLLLAIGLSAGLVNFEEENDVKHQFTPINSPSRYEQDVMDEFMQEKGTLYYLWVIILPKDIERSLLEPGPLEESYDLIKYLQEGLQIEHNGQNYSYSQFCDSYCKLNDPLTMFLAAFRNKEGRRNPNFKLRYPIVEIFGQEIYMGDTMHGVKLDNNGKVKSAKLVSVLLFSLKNERNKDMLVDWEKKVIESVHNTDEKYIKVLMNSQSISDSEVRRSGVSTGPFLILSFAIVLSFVTITSIRCEFHRSKVLESAAGVVGPLIATTGSFGALLLLGLKYQPIVTVTVFLVLAVGVDDVFLLLRAWHKSDPNSSVEERMGKTLSQAGPSITITSLTNALSFAVGILSQTPAIRTFCIYTTTAIIFSYLFQLTFFSGLLALSGRREARNLNPFCCCFLVRKRKLLSDKVMKRLAVWREQLLSTWTWLLVCWPTRVFVVVLLVVYWSIAVWGFTKIHVEITITKVLMPDSPLIEYSNVVNDHVLSEIQQLTVIVNNPGDLRKQNQLNRVHKLVTDFEKATHSEGGKSTQFWLRSYQNHLDFYGIKKFRYTKMRQFLEGYGTTHMSAYLRQYKPACKKNKPACVKAFIFTTGYRNVTSFAFRKQLLTEWRAICQTHSNLNASVHDVQSYFADQIESIKQTTKITVLVALICMALVCLVFIPNLVSVLCASLCVLSINMGVFGFLTHWGIDLDPICMASLLASIGFSVDFTAHMSYHYYKTDAESTNDRLTKAFDSIAWPTLQSGISTMLAIVVLFIHNSYLITVFAKTVILVCIFGLIHGLFILPVGLAALPYRKFKGFKERTEENSIKMKSVPQSANGTRSIEISET